MSDKSASVTITHHVQGQGGRYVAVVEGESVEGYLEWEPDAETREKQGGKDVRIATHTVVPRVIARRGVAARLVERLVEDARRLDFLIRPDCSYVASKFDDNPDWAALKA